MNYYIIYATYLCDDQRRHHHSLHRAALAAIEAGLDTEADDGMALHNYYAVYASAARRFARRHRVSKGLAQAGNRIDGAAREPARAGLHRPGAFRRAGRRLRARAMLSASLSGARPPLSMVARFDEIMERMGGRSEWSGRVGTRVLPAR